MLHLLVASFRALPLDLMVPVSRRGFVWIFSWIFFPPFCFFSVLFLWVSQSKRAISPALSVWTPSHMRTAPKNLPAASARKKFGTIYHFDMNLIWLRWGNRGHLPPCVNFSKGSLEWEKRGHTAKNVQTLLLQPQIQSCVLVCLTREKTW